MVDRLNLHIYNWPKSTKYFVKQINEKSNNNDMISYFKEVKMHGRYYYTNL